MGATQPSPVLVKITKAQVDGWALREPSKDRPPEAIVRCERMHASTRRAKPSEVADTTKCVQHQERQFASKVHASQSIQAYGLGGLVVFLVVFMLM